MQPRSPMKRTRTTSQTQRGKATSHWGGEISGFVSVRACVVRMLTSLEPPATLKISKSLKIRDRHDWTTGDNTNRNEWRKYPHRTSRTSLASPKGALILPETTWDRFRHFLQRGGGGNGTGVCDICVARACTRTGAPHK